MGGVTPGTTVELIDQAQERARAAQPRRGYLGMSGIARKDTRTTWLQWRWCLPDETEPRVLRIFQLGNLIEDEIVSLLKLTGVEVWECDPATGKQWAFSHYGGHYSGHSDGVIRGVPESPKIPMVLEIKSAKKSKFTELSGLVVSKPSHNDALKAWSLEYWGQCQCYMFELGLTRALFVVYCKDDSQIIALIIDQEPMAAESLLASAGRLIESDKPPASSFPNREWFEIKKFKTEYYQRVYWGDQAPPPNCRNCRHAYPDINASGGRWVCSRRECTVSIRRQAIGCELHTFIPALVPAEFIRYDGDLVQYRTADGLEFLNAPVAKRESVGFTSVELSALSTGGLSGSTLGDKTLDEIRQRFGAQVIEWESLA